MNKTEIKIIIDMKIAQSVARLQNSQENQENDYLVLSSKWKTDMGGILLH